MKRFFTLTTVALFMSTASYAEELCDPLIHKECICEKIPVMSKDGKRVLYYNVNYLCVVPNSSGSKLVIKDNDDTNGDNSDSASDDENDDDSNGDKSDDKSEDKNDDDSNGPSDDKNDDDSNGDNSEDSSEDKNDD